MRERRGGLSLRLLVAAVLPVIAVTAGAGVGGSGLAAAGPSGEAAPVAAAVAVPVYTPQILEVNGLGGEPGGQGGQGGQGGTAPLVRAPVVPIVVASGGGVLGIPQISLDAYHRAEELTAKEIPGCAIRWYHLAGIGKIESGHASSGAVDRSGVMTPPLYGPTLDGSLAGTAIIADTDAGKLDGITGVDRAMGPMQFIPGTWQYYARDADGDGKANPQSVFDAAYTAARYLCSGSVNMSVPEQAQQAVRRYNNSAAYVANVLTWATAYSKGVLPTANSFREMETGPTATTTATPATSASPAPSDAPPPPSVPAAPPAPAAPTPVEAAPPAPALPCLIAPLCSAPAPTPGAAP